MGSFELPDAIYMDKTELRAFKKWATKKYGRGYWKPQCYVEDFWEWDANEWPVAEFLKEIIDTSEGFTFGARSKAMIELRTTARGRAQLVLQEVRDETQQEADIRHALYMQEFRDEVGRWKGECKWHGRIPASPYETALIRG